MFWVQKRKWLQPSLFFPYFDFTLKEYGDIVKLL